MVVAIPVAVLFYFQFRSINDLASTSAVVLRQLSQETADAAANDVEDTLKRPHIGVLLAVPQARTDAMDLPCASTPCSAQGLEESPFVEAFYVWSADLAAAARHDARLQPRQPGRRLGRPRARFRDAPGVGAVVLPRLQQLLEHKRAIVAFPATIGGRQKYVQAQLRFPNADRDARSRASWRWSSTPRTSARVHLPAMMKARLASVQHLGGFPQLDLTLRDATGAR